MATVPELKEQAKALGIKGTSKMRKAELESAVAQATVSRVATDMPVNTEVLVDAPPSLADTRCQGRNKAKAYRRRLRSQGFQAGRG